MSGTDAKVGFGLSVVGVFVGIIIGSVPFLALGLVGLVVTTLFRK